MPNLTPNYSFNKPLVNNATDADLWGGQLNSNFDTLDTRLNIRNQTYDFQGNGLETAKLIDSSETAYSVGNVSGVVDIDYDEGHWQYATVTGDITELNLNALPSSGEGAWLTLELIQDGTGGHTLTLGSGSDYQTAGGAGVTLSTAAGARDFLHFTTRDSGTTVFVRLEANWS